MPRDWTEESRSVLNALTASGSTGRLSPDEVAALAKGEHATVDALMLGLLPIAQRFARPPISDFYVGAIGLGVSGAVYAGANLEIGGNALHQTIHAEQSVIANAFSHQETGLTAIAVTAEPCGHCRQFLNEITGAARIRVIVEGQQIRTLEDLLPASFGPHDLGNTTGMLDSAPAGLRLTSASQDPLAHAALAAASRSYAPYTKARSGCAILTAKGGRFAGSYLENAAFNPSLSPLQSALVRAVLAGDDIAAIEQVVLVELQDAAISQEASTRAALVALAPNARLQVLLATISE
jgi:cytidine deaminase